MSTITREFTKEQLIEEAMYAVNGCNAAIRVSTGVEARRISLRLGEIALAALTPKPLDGAERQELQEYRKAATERGAFSELTVEMLPERIKRLPAATALVWLDGYNSAARTDIE
ncbi:hypothetical protein [Enterobacter sp. C4G1]|uniref:hypothetical protein n=1 Tax=Enterobacter sp. C4G1 TaxID=3458724 RepID=UPI00406776E2